MTDRVETAILIPFGEARFIAEHRGEMSEFLAAIEANDAELVVLRAQRDAALALCDELERVAASGKPYEPIRTNALRAALGVQPEPAETPTFEQLLRDPTEQFDKDSELLPGLLRSIDEYRDAPSGTASAFAHKHAWGEWQPMPQVPRDRIRRESRRCKTWACDATQIRPVVGRCRATAAVEDVLRACERQHGDVPTPLGERIRQVLRDTTCDRHEAREAG